MAINENQENLEQEPQEVVEETPTMETPEKPQEVEEKVAEAPKPQPKAPQKTKFQFPHQLLMEKHNLTPKDLTEKTKEYLGDFEDFMKHVKMAKTSAERKGNEYVLPEAKKNKLIRLSKSVCTRITDKIDADNDIKEQEASRKEEEQRMLRERRENARNQRRDGIMKKREQSRLEAQEESKRKAEEEADDSIGFFF